MILWRSAILRVAAPMHQFMYLADCDAHLTGDASLSLSLSLLSRFGMLVWHAGNSICLVRSTFIWPCICHEWTFSLHMERKPLAAERIGCSCALLNVKSHRISSRPLRAGSGARRLEKKKRVLCQYVLVVCQDPSAWGAVSLLSLVSLVLVRVPLSRAIAKWPSTQGPEVLRGGWELSCSPPRQGVRWWWLKRPASGKHRPLHTLLHTFWTFSPHSV